MKVVVDASVALKCVLDEAGKDAAFALLDTELIAPSLWLLEAANALWRLAKRGEITRQEALERLQTLLDAPVTATRLKDDLQNATAIANQIGNPVYDCLYLALALREDTYVVTADARFAGAVAPWPNLKDSVRVLGT